MCHRRRADRTPSRHFIKVCKGKGGRQAGRKEGRKVGREEGGRTKTQGEGAAAMPSFDVTSNGFSRLCYHFISAIQVGGRTDL